MAEFSERFCLDLTDTLTCYIELFSNFFQCSCATVLQTKTECQNFLLSLGQCSKYFLQLLF